MSVLYFFGFRTFKIGTLTFLSNFWSAIFLFEIAILIYFCPSHISSVIHYSFKSVYKVIIQ